MCVFVWQSPFNYLPPPVGCIKIPRVRPERLARCLLQACITKTNQLAHSEAPVMNFVTTGGEALIISILHVLTLILHVLSLHGGLLNKAQHGRIWIHTRTM